MEELGRLATTLGMEVVGFSSRTGETARVIWAVASGRSFGAGGRPRGVVRGH